MISIAQRVASAAHTGELRTRYLTLDTREVVTASHGTRIQPHATLDAASTADLVIVPGGGWNDRAPESAWAEADRGELPSALRDHQGRRALGRCLHRRPIAR